MSILTPKESPLLDLASLVHDTKALVCMANLRCMQSIDPNQDTSAHFMNDIKTNRSVTPCQSSMRPMPQQQQRSQE